MPPAKAESPPPFPIEVVELSIDRIQADLKSGRYTSAQLVSTFLHRIELFEGRYNAFISLNPHALATAEALDEERQLSGIRGPLHGIPIVLKDNLDIAGLVTTAGYAGFSSATDGIDMVPGEDAVVVERLEEAGAVILGKTNLPDFAGHGTRTRSSVAGTTLNPYNVDKAPGGSSGGTATAVNASFAVAGLGTETGGSIQNPAAAQALVGVKPTFGLAPLDGVVPMSGTVDVVGPLARTVKDAAYLLDVIAGASDEDLRTVVAEGRIPEDGFAAGLSSSALEGKRFGLVGTGWRSSFLPLDPATDSLYQEAIQALEAQGATVVADPFAGTGFIEAYGRRRRGGSGGVDFMARYLEGLGPGASFNSVEEWESLSGRPFRSSGRDTMTTEARDSLRARFAERAAARDASSDAPARGQREVRSRVAGTGAEAPGTFQEWRAGIQALFRNVMQTHDLDGLFFPQAGAPIPDLVEDPQRPEYNPNNHPELPSNIINDMGLPVVTLPFAYYADGTPFVLAFIGEPWTESELLSFAYDLEQATQARRPPTLEKPSGG